MNLSSLGKVTNRRLQEIQDIMKKKDGNMGIREIKDYMKEVKNMNIGQSKELIDFHVNIAMEMKNRGKNIDYQQCCRMEHEIKEGCNIKETITALEAKMVRKYDKYTILRLMSLLSTTNSGLKQAEFDQIRRAFITCYGY